MEKRGRTKEVGNTVGNPIYQRGLQVLEFAPDDALSPTQDSYQPLVENTREPGASKEYQDLENEEGCDERKGVSVDQEGYEGLVRNQTHKYQGLDQDKKHMKDQRKSDDLNPKNLRQCVSSPSETDQCYSVSSQPPRSPLGSQLNVTQSVIPLRLDASPFSPNKYQAGASSHFDKSSSMPLYYVLESSGTTAEKGPACINTHPKGSNTVPLQMRGVIEELKAATTRTTVEVDSTKKEPIYYVLERPNPTPESGVDHMHKVIGELKSLNVAGQRGEYSNECSAVPLDDDVFEDPKD